MGEATCGLHQNLAGRCEFPAGHGEDEIDGWQVVGEREAGDAARNVLAEGLWQQHESAVAQDRSRNG